MKDLISIIIPLYNKEKWVKRAVISVLNQTYQNFEIIIVNDGSTDGSKKEVESIKDERIFIFDKPNGGISSARNYGIEKSKGEFIALLDADDEWKPMHLDILLNGIKKDNNVILSCDDIMEKYSNKIIYRKLPFNLKEMECKIINNYIKTLRDGYFLLSGSSVLIKKEIIIKNNLRFLTDAEPAEDVNFWIRLSRFGKFVFCNYKGVIYHRIDENSIMNKKTKEVKLTPPFLYKIDWSKFSQKENKYLKEFVIKEYYKSAYNNKKKDLKKEEFSFILYKNDIKISFINLIIYFIIRFMPKSIIKIVKLRKRRKDENICN